MLETERSRVQTLFLKGSPSKAQAESLTATAVAWPTKILFIVLSFMPTRRSQLQENTHFMVSPLLHRLANPGTIPLENIKVLSDSFLSEDGIVRFEDNYGRSK